MAEKLAQQEIAFIDRQGREQRGAIEELLGDPTKGIETIEDAIALCFYAQRLNMTQALEGNEH